MENVQKWNELLKKYNKELENKTEFVEEEIKSENSTENDDDSDKEGSQASDVINLSNNNNGIDLDKLKGSQKSWLNKLDKLAKNKLAEGEIVKNKRQKRLFEKKKIAKNKYEANPSNDLLERKLKNIATKGEVMNHSDPVGLYIKEAELENNAVIEFISLKNNAICDDKTPVSVNSLDNILLTIDKPYSLEESARISDRTMSSMNTLPAGYEALKKIYFETEIMLNSYNRPIRVNMSINEKKKKRYIEESPFPRNK